MPGYLPFSRASFMLDTIALALLIIVPLMIWAIYEVAVRKNYRRHKQLIVTTAALLFFAVFGFEVDIRLNGWRHMAKASPYYDTWVYPILYCHLVFAISTVFLWVGTLWSALKRFPNPPRPSEFSATHMRIARLSAFSMTFTALTGWIFYYLAFVA